MKSDKRHDYLGMTLDYGEKHKVKIDMTKYLDKILSDLSNKFDGKSLTLAASYLFETNEHCDKLDKQSSEHFHHVVTQLLFL